MSIIHRIPLYLVIRITPTIEILLFWESQKRCHPHSRTQSKKLMESSKRNLIVHQMNPAEFVDFTQGINIVNQYKPIDSDWNNFSWLDFDEFKYERKLIAFKFRDNVNDEYRTFLLGRMRRKKNMNPKLVFNNDPFISVQTTESLTL